MGAVAAAVMRFSVLPTLVAELMEQGARRGQAARTRPARGRRTPAWGSSPAALGSPSDRPDLKAVAAVLGEWRALAHSGGGHATLEWRALAVKSEVPVWDDLGAASRLMQRIKAQLDPNNLLNPGRFVAGI